MKKLPKSQENANIAQKHLQQISAGVDYIIQCRKHKGHLVEVLEVKHHLNPIKSVYISFRSKKKILKVYVIFQSLNDNININLKIKWQ